jgi:hypothetical protein
MKSIKSGAFRTPECPLTGIITLFACGALACGEVVFDPVAVGGSINGGAGSGQAGRAGNGGSSSVSNGGSSGANGGSSGANGGTGGSNGGNGGNGSGSGNNGGTSSSGAGGTDDPGNEPDAGDDSDGGPLDAGASDAGPVNLISNPDFESGFTPWSAAFGGTMGVATDQARSGLQCGRVSGRTAAYQGAHYNLTSVTTPGATYAATAFGRISGATSTAPLIFTARINCLGIPDPAYRTVRSLTGNDSAWTELSGSFVMPSCTPTEVLLYLEGPPSGYTIYIDDVSVFEQ